MRVPLLMGGVVAALLVGCGPQATSTAKPAPPPDSRTSPPAGTSTTGRTAAPRPSASSTATAAGTGGSTTAGQQYRDTRASIRFCTPEEVQLALVNSRTTKNDGAIETILQVRNTGTRNCEERGFPGVSFTDAGGGAVGAPATRSTGGTTPLIGLQPGDTATASLGTLAGPGSCATPRYIVVYLPNQTQAVRLVNSVPLHYCPSGGPSDKDPQAPPRFAIGPFRAGR